MPLTQILFILYGCLLLSGAYFGLKAGSKISLIMGIASGLLTFCGVYLVGMNPKCGYSFLSCLSGLLSVVFLIRLIKTKKFMPAGLLLGISLGALILGFNQILGL